MKFGKTALIILILLCVSASLRLNSSAQIRPVYDQGTLGLAQLLKGLNTTASALMIGAHPDDEDTALLAYLARGESARTAYLSLTRGDGGQNILGTELGEALGVIRTEELLQARKLDGAEQFFTRAYDYGFSKTLAEAKEKWDERIILCDVVRVIRSYQPLVVISQFSGTPADGHGQHQYAGYISPLAVKAAGDAEQCKEAGQPWIVKKFYLRHRGQGEPTLRINTGKYDPLLGRSYFEIAMHARSQHRSQEQGVFELKGDQFSSLKFVDGSVPRPERERGVFDGLDVSTNGLGTTVSRAAAQSLDSYKPLDPATIVPALLDGYATLANGKSGDAIATAKRTEFADAVLLASGVRVDALTLRETVVKGGKVPVSVSVFVASAENVKLVETKFNIPQKQVNDPVVSIQGQGPVRRETAAMSAFFELSVPTDAQATQLFWLVQTRRDNLFSIENGSPVDSPLAEPAIFADITLEVLGKPIQIRRPVEYRYADDIRGEIRRMVSVVPRIGIAFDSTLMVAAKQSKTQKKEIVINVTNNFSAPASGRVRLIAPKDWQVSFPWSDFYLNSLGQKTSLKFYVDVPAQAELGSYEIGAEASFDGDTFSQTMQTIAYEHIQTHRIYRRAKADVRLIDLRTVPLKVGYIRGSGDRVHDAIKQLGIDVEEIDERLLSTGDLLKFDTVVVGIRAYQVRHDLVANNQRLLDFANNGGTLIVQYQLPATFPQQNLTPFPAQLGPRVADENAPVTILQPTHPIFNFPNKITAEDFKGWVQERNLYNFSTMDPKYVGLLESHDAGEAENKGGLVVADIGKGKYIYCSYSLFRQLPAGVPGAYRLLANMVSLPKTAQ